MIQTKTIVMTIQTKMFVRMIQTKTLVMMIRTKMLRYDDSNWNDCWFKLNWDDREAACL